ncbi:TPA: lvrE [Legionella pneumophila]|nr:lvrE [Legionella pneumophila]
MKKKVVSLLVWGVVLGLSQPGFANPASTEYVTRHISDAMNEIKSYIKSEVNSILTQVNSQRISMRKMGELYQGGVVFFVDESRIHGLIAAKVDANNGEGIQWQNGVSGEKIINARANGVHAGETNTRLIISQQTVDDQGGTFAALIASNYAVLEDGITSCAASVHESQNCYGGWYLPSLYELDLMRRNLTSIYQLAQAPYWSSTESSVTESWAEEVVGSPMLLDKSLTHARVRAIRSF